ncbi:MAG: hypothetical protein ACI4C1_07785 [Lachnospiraceae bacterium]
MKIKNMAQKAAKTVEKAVFGEKKTPEELEQEIKQQASDSVKRAQEIAEILKSINFSKCSLNEEFIRNCKSVQKVAITELENAQVMELDVTEIDKELQYVALCLKESIEGNQKETAEWAYKALSNGVLYQRKDVPASERNMISQWKAAKEKYMRKYHMMLDNCKTLDRLERDDKQKQIPYEKQVEDYKKIKAEYESKSTTEEGLGWIAELKDNLDHPERISADAFQFNDLMREYVLTCEAMLDKEKTIAILRARISKQMRVIEFLADSLTNLPRVEDPLFIKKMEEIAEDDQETIENIIRQNVEIDEFLNKNHAAMQHIFSSPALSNEIADNLNKIEELEYAEKMKNQYQQQGMKQQQEAEKLKQHEKQRVMN